MSRGTAGTDPKTRFTGRAALYSKYRPSYPEELIDVLQKESFLTRSSTLADVGSGTGLLTELFLKNGNAVFAVEPNADMRHAAERALGGYGGFHSIEASAERTTLPDASVDLVVAGQAFHWFSTLEARSEFARISRNRHVAVIYNTREHGLTGLSADYDRLIRTHGRDFAQVRGPEDRLLDLFFADYRLITLPNPRKLDLEGLAGRLLSASYMPAPDEPGYGALLDGVREVFSRHQKDGMVTMNLTTELFIGTI